MTKAGKIEEVKVNTEAALQTIKQEISQQSETLQERLKKRKLGKLPPIHNYYRDERAQAAAGGGREEY